MSYRIWASNYKRGDREKDGRVSTQVYGNNEFPKEIHDYLESKGCKFDEDDCFEDFEITDIQEFLEAMLVAHNSYVKDDSYWDFKPRSEIKTPNDLISHCWQQAETSYVFIVFNFYMAFETQFDMVWDEEEKRVKYQLLKGTKLYLSGY